MLYSPDDEDRRILDHLSNILRECELAVAQGGSGVQEILQKMELCNGLMDLGRRMSFADITDKLPIDGSYESIYDRIDAFLMDKNLSYAEKIQGVSRV